MEMFSRRIDASELQRIFLDYKNIAPEQCLSSINRQQLDSNESSLSETMKRDNHLPNSSINISVVWSLRKTNGTLNLKYIRKLATSVSVSE